MFHFLHLFISGHGDLERGTAALDTFSVHDQRLQSSGIE
jgi:hypothetical protein